MRYGLCGLCLYRNTWALDADGTKDKCSERTDDGCPGFVPRWRNDGKVGRKDDDQS